MCANCVKIWVLKFHHVTMPPAALNEYTARERTDLAAALLGALPAPERASLVALTVSFLRAVEGAAAVELLGLACVLPSAGAADARECRALALGAVGRVTSGLYDHPRGAVVCALVILLTNESPDRLTEPMEGIVDHEWRARVARRGRMLLGKLTREFPR